MLTGWPPVRDVRDINWSGINQGYVRDIGNFPEKSGISDLLSIL